MGTLYALLVGIDDYSTHGERSLRGCLNDVAAVEEWLRQRVRDRLRPLVLRDGEATAAAVAEGVSEHLGRCGPDDSALFWFSGHGTRFPAERPEDVRKEATGWCQALVCADRPLVDSRLGQLLDAVAAGGGHTVAVLDCCYSGGATRQSRLVARFLPPAPGWRAPRDATATASPAQPAGQRHVLLAASRLDQLAHEDVVDGRTHGLFTHALLSVLGTGAYRGATCRELLAAAHARVQVAAEAQHPVLHPHHPGGPADRPFLGTTGATAPAPHLLRLGRDGWEVDCGGAHGLRPGGDGTEFTVTGRATAGPAHTVRARQILRDRTLVWPAGWEPDPERVYPVALSALDLPPAMVTVEAAGRAESELLEDALRTVGPGGMPSPLLRREASADAAAGLLLLRVRAAAGRAEVLRRDGSAFVAPLPLGDPGDARRVAACLVHLARWHQIRDLENPAALARSPVRVEVVPVEGDEGALSPGDGVRELVCRYTRTASGWRAPRVAIRLRNRSHRTLWCALFNLTDSYRSHSVLFPGDFVGPGRTGHALDGDPVQLSLPAGSVPRSGATVRDWLKLVVAEGELNTVPFHLDAWDPATAAHRIASGQAVDGTLRLAPPGGAHRDLGPAPVERGPGDWTTYTLSLRTVVP
ncbi:caspase domain-containing protein [Streptomyces sp. NPDC127098]|uniref:caspase family protein n=1 Tax=Streptomyces sp. NPDC127098 TaxID=3347137 RepID=UPI0036698D98